jgi:hypothetical protein
VVRAIGQRTHDSRPRSVGSNPTVYWMDGRDASYYIFIEKKNKGSQKGHTKKKIQKEKLEFVSYLKKISYVKVIF